MTEVYFRPSSEGFVFRCSGHAGYAEKGRDIVCAGISALCIALVSTAGALEQSGKLTVREIEENDGLLELTADYSENITEKALAAGSVFTVINGLSEIEKHYPKNLKIETDFDGGKFS